MPREIGFLGLLMPTLLPLSLAGALIAWVIDRLLAWSGLYRLVWHPALFRASLLLGICALLGLTVYR